MEACQTRLGEQLEIVDCVVSKPLRKKDTGVIDDSVYRAEIGDGRGGDLLRGCNLADVAID
jgi:hypothetical protein